MKAAIDLQKSAILEIADLFGFTMLAWPKSRKTIPDLRRDLIDYGVHSSPCSFYRAVGNIFRCNHRALRYIPGRADRSRLNAASSDGEPEHD